MAYNKTMENALVLTMDFGDGTAYVGVSSNAVSYTKTLLRRWPLGLPPTVRIVSWACAYTASQEVYAWRLCAVNAGKSLRRAPQRVEDEVFVYLPAADSFRESVIRKSRDLVWGAGWKLDDLAMAHASLGSRFEAPSKPLPLPERPAISSSSSGQRRRRAHRPISHLELMLQVVILVVTEVALLAMTRKNPVVGASRQGSSGEKLSERLLVV